MSKTPLGTIVFTGDVCPESGEYQIERKPEKVIAFKKGDKMPANNWMSVGWKLVKYAA